MECSTKVFGEGALGLKAQMAVATGCLIVAFKGEDVQNLKKLGGALNALNLATHGAIAKAVAMGDLEAKSGSSLLLSATDAWAAAGFAAGAAGFAAALGAFAGAVLRAAGFFGFGAGMQLSERMLDRVNATPEQRTQIQQIIVGRELLRSAA